MDWYKGDTILEAMDNIHKDKSLVEKPLRFPVQDVYKFDDRRIIAGRIESGTLSVGDEILISPEQKLTRVKTIEHWADTDKRNVAYAGMSVGITLEDEFFNKRGEFISHVNESPLIGNLFNANIFWMGKKPLEKNKSYKLKISTQEVECEIFAINRIIDASTLESTNNSQIIQKNDVAEVTIKTKHMISFDEFKNIHLTGRFVLVDELDVSGGGIIIGIEDSLQNRELNTKSINIAPRKRLVTRKDREEKFKQKGKVIWLTGLPGCGKNEIALKLEKKLFDLGNKVYYLDSANIRFGLSSDLTFTTEDSREQTRRIAEVANLFADSGTVTIVTSVSRFKKDREYAKTIIGTNHYMEIFIDATEEVYRKRNAKGVYEDSDGQFIYEKSEEPVITLHIDREDFNSEQKAQSIMELLK